MIVWIKLFSQYIHFFYSKLFVNFSQNWVGQDYSYSLEINIPSSKGLFSGLSVVFPMALSRLSWTSNNSFAKFEIAKTFNYSFSLGIFDWIITSMLFFKRVLIPRVRLWGHLLILWFLCCVLYLMILINLLIWFNHEPFPFSL